MLSFRGSTLSKTCWTQRHLFRRLRCQLYFSTSSSKVRTAHESACIDGDCADFLPWLELKAGTEISSVLSIGESAYGRSLFACRPIKAGDCILKVPYSVQLSSNNLPLGINSLLGDQVSNVAKVALFVLYEQQLGEQSEWAPYISRLPQPAEMHSTIFWDHHELEMIQQSPLYEETIRQKKIIETDFLVIMEALSHFLEDHLVITLEDFKYAYALVTSRAWESSNGVSMIPFADFLNHDGGSDSCVLNDEGKQHSEVIADRDYAPGDQVLIRYGKFSNATLLLDFGFTLLYNAYDQVQVKLNIPQQDHLSSMKLELLSKHCTPAIKDVNVFNSAGNSFTLKEVRSAQGKGRGIPQSFRAYARVMCSNSPQEINDLAIEAAENDGRLARRPLRDKCREIEAHQFLLLRITELIKLYNASIKSLELQTSLHVVNKPACRYMMAHDLLSGELHILKSAAEWLENYCVKLLQV
nr:fructose-bisphosphate aldolase-lysine N-methyltransferase, chloroplastic [Ipomoea batatas]